MVRVQFYYHAFSMLVYFTPLLGGIIADTWLGKFWYAHSAEACDCIEYSF